MKLNNESAKKLRRDFPIFKNNKGLIYLDNASTTQKPMQVIDSISEYYGTANANIHRGIYGLSQKATEKYGESRKNVARFINASPEEIIFTRSTTESINLLSYALESLVPGKNGKDEILLTEMEHHSNIVPWQQLAKRRNMKLKFAKVNADFTLDLRDLAKKITSKTAILSIAHVSNALGTINPVRGIAKLARKKGAITVIDAAQSIAHMKIDVKKMGCDFLAFSGHKIYAPTGIGVLYGRTNLLEKIQPFNFGGDMIKSVSLLDSEWNTIPERFEAGTQNISGAIALADAVKYVEKIGIKNIGNYERNLADYAAKILKSVDGIVFYRPKGKDASPIISFNLGNIHGHDVASMLDDYGICVRAGHHCTMPLMKKLGISGTARMSISFYNTREDIDRLVKALKEISEKFNGKGQAK
jgi:cysteine desulfurase/selenocysteine lyase